MASPAPPQQALPDRTRSSIHTARSATIPTQLPIRPAPLAELPSSEDYEGLFAIDLVKRYYYHAMKREITCFFLLDDRGFDLADEWAKRADMENLDDVFDEHGRVILRQVVKEGQEMEAEIEADAEIPFGESDEDLSTSELVRKYCYHAMKGEIAVMLLLDKRGFRMTEVIAMRSLDGVDGYYLAGLPTMEKVDNMLEKYGRTVLRQVVKRCQRVDEDEDEDEDDDGEDDREKDVGKDIEMGDAWDGHSV
ncbi:unnamed protein product [Zymoseptoria tritici ST99CH_1A5]|uniref:Uncharacterized protein n=1 Tax=Zymoseptoria tritici ST99CH_1A5 TaxID=1276529 RepID=A0A1Y6LKX0_ZYMTR|nr:unnamed protein product [Zymoseptoria tritici ST99CH_1A5]